MRMELVQKDLETLRRMFNSAGEILDRVEMELDPNMTDAAVPVDTGDDRLSDESQPTVAMERLEESREALTDGMPPDVAAALDEAERPLATGDQLAELRRLGHELGLKPAEVSQVVCEWAGVDELEQLPAEGDHSAAVMLDRFHQRRSHGT